MTAFTAAVVRDVWEANLWGEADILALTPKIHMHEVTEENEFLVDKLCYEGVVNFFTCRVRVRSQPLIGGLTRYTARVTVQYHLQQADVSESTYNDVEDALGTVDALVISALGPDWGGTVDYYLGSEPPDIRPVTINLKQCWQGTLGYTAFKTT